MIKVLFNDKCSICSTEINHYKSLNTNDIYWLDINDLRRSYEIIWKDT